MIRGTTARFVFKLPCTKGELVQATIKFSQENNPSRYLPITRRLSECGGQNDENILQVSLRPDETALFSEKYKGKIQLRATRIDGTVFGSRPQLFTVYPMNDDIIEEIPPVVPDIPEENEDGWIIFDGGVITT